MKDNQILAMNLDDYTCLMATERSNYRTNENNLKTGNTSATPGRLKFFIVVVLATLFI
jgi:hypothetical protein